LLGERFSESTDFRRRVALARDLADHGADVAIVTDDTTLTYAELAERVDDVAGQLGATRRLVMVEAENTLGAVVAYLGGLAGGHAVMLVPAADALVRERLLTAYDPDVICWSGPHAPLLDERRRDSAHELHPDLALLLSTSGSMGSPKLVRLSAENLDANATAIASYLDLRADDCAATTLPMSYC
jgi:acyl-CoA synthetase (AMP-forming)/AMP-acid ligase II